MDRFDRYWIGILLGLIIPAAFGLTYIEVMNLWYPLQTLQFQAGGVLSKLLLVSVFPDLALIFVFYTPYRFDVIISAAFAAAGCLPKRERRYS